MKKFERKWFYVYSLAAVYGTTIGYKMTGKLLMTWHEAMLQLMFTTGLLLVGTEILLMVWRVCEAIREEEEMD